MCRHDLKKCVALKPLILVAKTATDADTNNKKPAPEGVKKEEVGEL